MKKPTKCHNIFSVGDEGLKQKNPTIICKHFEEQIEPTENFRVALLYYFNQNTNETLDNFVTRCRQQAQKYNFHDETLNELFLNKL